MSHEDPWDNMTVDAAFDDQSLQDYVWATSDAARMKALSLYLIRSIVEKHGGTIDVDLATDTININVPAKEQVACAQEIEEQVGSMC
jgi:hypothetical protein